MSTNGSHAKASYEKARNNSSPWWATSFEQGPHVPGRDCHMAHLRRASNFHQPVCKVKSSHILAMGTPRPLAVKHHAHINPAAINQKSNKLNNLFRLCADALGFIVCNCLVVAHTSPPGGLLNTRTRAFIHNGLGLHVPTRHANNLKCTAGPSLPQVRLSFSLSQH